MDEEINKIFLCGERFSIPLAQEGITYIGINNPVVVIDSKIEVDWEEKKIVLAGVKYDSKYQGIVDGADETKRILYQKAVENVAPNASAQSSKRSNRKSLYGKYISNSYINFMLTPADKNNSEKSFELLAKEIGSVKYDIDKDIESAKKMLVDAKVVNLAENYLKSL